MTGSSDFDEESAIGNYWTDHIYPAEFRNGLGKYFNIVTEDDGNTSIEYQPPYPTRNRIKLTVTFLRQNNEIKEVTLKKFKEYKTGWREQAWGPGEPMKFSHFSFEKLACFLRLLTELDLANLNQRRIALREDKGAQNDPETTAKVRAILMLGDGHEIIDELLRNGLITSRDIVNIGYRKKQLDVFEELLRDEHALDNYQAEHEIAGNQPEKVWQHFFRTNEWIFGFGLDYRFLGILQSEAHIAAEDLSGRDGAVSDFLLGATNFTVLVEVKTPNTPLFRQRLNRANSWQLSSELVGAVSQILEQKASWQIKGETNAAGNFDRAGNLITQRTIDPKSILIVGSDRSFANGDAKELAVKLRTFELFRRDSRNIEIVTYDELFERAKFIVGNSGRADLRSIATA